MCLLKMQVCPTGVPEERRGKEYAQMAKDLIETATTANPPLPLTALLVQVSVLFGSLYLLVNSFLKSTSIFLLCFIEITLVKDVDLVNICPAL